MSSSDKVTEIKSKVATWKAEKEKELLRKVLLLKKVTVSTDKVTTTYTNNVYTDVVKGLDIIKGNT